MSWVKILLCFLTLGLANAQTGRQAQTGVILQRILVKIDEGIITQTDLEDQYLELMGRRQFPAGQRPRPGVESFLALQSITPEVIATLVEDLLIFQHGQDRGYELTDERFEELVEEIKMEQGLDSDQEFAQLVRREEGISVDRFRRIMERQMVIKQIKQLEVLNRAKVTDKEVEAYYQANIDEFMGSATVAIREILIKGQNRNIVGTFATAAMDDRAKAAAQEARQRVLDGEEFAAVVAEVSVSPSKLNDGLIGPIDLSMLSATLIEALSSLEIGGVTEVVRTERGDYQILKLEARTEAGAIPFEQVSERIRDEMLSDRYLAEYSQLIDRLNGQVIIEWRDEQLRHAYEEYLNARNSRLQVEANGSEQ